MVILKDVCHGDVLRRTGHFYVSFFWHVKRKKTGLYFIVLNLQQIWQWGSAFIKLWAFILGIFDTDVSWRFKAGPSRRHIPEFSPPILHQFIPSIPLIPMGEKTVFPQLVWKFLFCLVQQNTSSIIELNCFPLEMH